MKIKSTSRNHAVGEDIVLRIGKTSRLIFRPELVDNNKNKEAPLRGTFIYQKKKLSGSWEDYQISTLNHLKDSEGIKLLLHSEEVLRLLEGLEAYKGIYEKYGIRIGENNFVLTSQNMAEVLEKLASYDNLDIVLEKLENLKISNLQTLDALIGVSTLKKVYGQWKKEKNNSDEKYWQGIFVNYPWILSQIFPYKVTILEGKRFFVGGKSISDKGGGLVDFLYKKELMDNVIFFEIKTPKTPLLSSKYRDNSYSISNDLSGAINQVLGYKDTLTKEFANRRLNSEESFEVFNPKTIIIVGSLENEKMNQVQKKSFELFRNELKNVEIITFDELFGKVKHLIDLLGGENETRQIL